MSSTTMPKFKPARAADRTLSLASAEAFSQLYEETHLSVYRYIYGLCGGPQQDVEDLAAATFERAWKARKRFKGDGDAALGWLLLIARRLVIDTQRRRNRRGLPADIDELSLSFPENGPEDQALSNERQQILCSMLQTLPTERREILILRYMLGWQVKRIAAHLSSAENTISVTIHRTLKRLREDWPQDSSLLADGQEGDL